MGTTCEGKIPTKVEQKINLKINYFLKRDIEVVDSRVSRLVKILTYSLSLL